MISLKNLVGMFLTGLLFVSCTPAYPPGHRPDQPYQNPALGPNQPQQKTIAQLERELAAAKAEEKHRKEEQARAVEAAAQDRVTQGTPTVINPTTTTNPTPDTPRTDQPIKRQTAYQTARVIPGKAGYVFNPWTNNAVDVRGIPSGSLVWDPNDPNKATHKFRVP